MKPLDLALWIILTGFAIYNILIFFNNKFNEPKFQDVLIPPDTVNLLNLTFPYPKDIKSVDGKNSGQQIAQKTSIIAILSTKCSACLSAKPKLESIYRNNKANVGFLGIFSEPRNNVLAYKAEYPKFVLGDKNELKDLKILGTPTFYIIRDNKVIYQAVGWSEEVGDKISRIAGGEKI